MGAGGIQGGLIRCELTLPARSDWGGRSPHSRVAALASWGEPPCVPVPAFRWAENRSRGGHALLPRVGGWRGGDSAWGLGPTDATGAGAGPCFSDPPTSSPWPGPLLPSTRSLGIFIYFYCVLFPRAAAARTRCKQRGCRSGSGVPEPAARVRGGFWASGRALARGRGGPDANPGPAELRVRCVRSIW